MERSRTGWWATLLLLLGLAAALRLYRLGTLPAGLHFDEAGYGMQALEVLGGSTPVFFSSHAGREAGFQYLVAVAVALLGRTILAIRLPAALLGVALVAAIALVGRRSLGRGGALLAAGAAAGAPWLVHVNRIGFRANLLPVALTLWGWLLLRALETNRRRDWLAAGLWLGLTAYTYLSSRIVPLLLVLFVAYLACWQRPLLRRSGQGLALMLGVAVLLAIPLAVHYVRVPSDWGARVSQIHACSGLPWDACLLRVADHAWRTLLMVGFRGDPLVFFNLPGEPALPLPVGWLFYVGVLVALRRWRQPGLALLLLWWVTLVIPAVLSADSPHFLRSIGAAPPTMLLWALGAGSIAGWVRQRRPRVKPLLPLAGAGLVLLITLISARDYFLRWAGHPYLYYAYMEYVTQAAREVAAVPAEADLYISEYYYRHSTFLYLAERTQSALWFDARYGWPQAHPGRRSFYVISASTPADPRAAPFLAGGIGRDVTNQLGQYGYSTIDMSNGLAQPPEPGQPLQASLGSLQLTGATLAQSDAEAGLRLTIFWTVRRATERDLRFFVHLLDSAGRKIAQQDVIGYASRDWRAGDRFASFHSITLPADLRPGDYRLALGLYDTHTFERMPAAGDLAQADALMLPVRLTSSGAQLLLSTSQP